MCLCDTDAACGDIFIDGGAGGLLEDPANIGFAQEKIRSQLFYRNILTDILIYIDQDIVHLLTVFVIAYTVFGGIGIGEGIDHHQQFHEGSLLHNIMGVAPGGGDLADIIEKAPLCGLVQGDFVLKMAVPVGKAIIQIRIRGRNPFDEIRIDGQHNPFMDTVVNLGQFMAFILVDNKQISRGDGIKAVVDEKLLSTGDGIIQFVTVMDMHVHGFFLFIEVGDGKGSGALAIFDGGFAGIDFFHVQEAPFVISDHMFTSAYPDKSFESNIAA